MTADIPRKGVIGGFSLLEVLATISVIAILAGTVIPIMSNVLDKGDQYAARRNAQTIAGMANSALAAGNTEIPAAASKEEVVDLLSSGVNGEGQFAEDVFMVHLPESERIKTLPFLEFDGGVLEFDPSESE